MSRFYANECYVQDIDDSELYLKTLEKFGKLIYHANDLNEKKGLYTGAAGSAYALHRIGECVLVRSKIRKKCRKYARYWINKASKYFEKVPNTSSNESASLMAGALGVNLVEAIVHRNEQASTSKVTSRLYDLAECIRTNPLSFCDELFNGKAGWLAASAVLGRECDITIDDQYIITVLVAMLSSGRDLARQRLSVHKQSPPLMYAWHEKEYIGAAHGLAGILTMMLNYPQQLRRCDIKAWSDVRETVDWILSIQEKNGNWPSSTGRIGHNLGKNELVHWCHGAPGVIYLMANAYMAYGDDKYLQACIKAGDVIWHKGLLKKGLGLCHGVSGNAYALLLLYRLTDDHLYLRKAHSFAKFMCSNREFVVDCWLKPQNPMSLFEGVGGGVCLLVDLLAPTAFSMRADRDYERIRDDIIKREAYLPMFIMRISSEESVAMIDRSDQDPQETQPNSNES